MSSGGSAFGAALAELPLNLAQHVRVVALSLACAVALATPLTAWLVRRARAREWVLGAASVAQTIPGLALLALMVPAFALLAELAAPVGIHVRTIGLGPTVSALTIYALLPLLRSSLAGLTNVDPDLIEAARGLGMTDSQVLRRVRAPLALPVIVSGLRTAAVWTVGAATLATPVGQRSLGNFIFGGLATRNWAAVVMGCVGAALLALAIDQLIGAAESGLRTRRPRRTRAAGLAVAALFLVGLAAPPWLERGAGARVRVGAKPFTEQLILARVLEARLEGAGLRVEVVESLGSTVAFDALVAGEIDAYVDYTGTLWATVLGRSDRPGREAVLAETERVLAEQYGVRLLGGLGFENAYALAVRGADGAAWGCRSIADLAARAGSLALGADYEFLQRAEWAELEQAYGLRFAREVELDPSFLYEALARGEVDVVPAYTSDGRVAADGLLVLEDPRGVLPPYDAVLLVSGRAPEGVAEALRPLVGAIDVESMRAANWSVDRRDGGVSPTEAAAALNAR